MSNSIRNGGGNFGIGGDLEGMIASVLAEVGNTATELARDVVDAIKTNNNELKLLRDIRAALRGKDMGKFNALLDANPDLKEEFKSKMPEGKIPEGGSHKEKVEEEDLGFIGNGIRSIGQALGVVKPQFRTVQDPPKPEEIDLMDSALDDIVQTRNAFGQEQQVTLQDVLSKVTQAVQANSQISSRFDTLANTIIGNLRG